MKTILLYGATGFNGRLIAAEGKAQGMSNEQSDSGYRMILGARNGPELLKVAKLYGMDARVFALDDPAVVLDQLHGIDVVINAAGPFACTAQVLVNAAIATGHCHYVDINGEADVYLQLLKLAVAAERQHVAIVPSAASSGGASNVLLNAALQQLVNQEIEELGAIRIAVLLPKDLSHGSAASLARSVREQVIVLRNVGVDGNQGVISYEPVGKLERLFNFGHPTHPDREHDRSRGACDGDAEKIPAFEIATSANLVDTLIAGPAVAKCELSVQRIESYVQMDRVGRIAHILGGMFAPVSALPPVRALLNAQIDFIFLADPVQQDMERERLVVLLEIEDRFSTPLIDWRWETPNVYQFTAQLVLAAARNVVMSNLVGWVTPAEILRLGLEDLEERHDDGVLKGCTPLERRPVPLERKAV